MAKLLNESPKFNSKKEDMEIIKCSPEMSVDRMYCPSTDEVIFAPDYEMIILTSLFSQ